MNDISIETYSVALVSYIDVLGFADLIKASRADESKIAKTLSLLTTVKEKFSRGGRIHRRPDGERETIFHSFNFSDLTVCTTRIPDGTKFDDYIDWELFYLSDTQLSLALDGFLIRGGISIGAIFIGAPNGIVFGPALVKSYQLESQYAVYPRIIIDRDLIAEAERGGYLAYFEDYLQRGEDGAYFLDYLFGSSSTGFTVPGATDPKPQITAHRKMIEDFIADDIRGKHERIKQKYLWLALYHNSTLKRLRSRFESHFSNDFSQFVIPENLLDF